MTDNWEFYQALVDHEPASILLDVGIASNAPIKHLSHMAFIRIYMQNPTACGLSSNEEYDILCRIEDCIDNVVAGLTERMIVYVGRNTSGGCRDLFFYCRPETDIHNIANEAGRAFPTYELEAGIRPDAEWDTYFHFLFPSDSDWQNIYNRKVYENLQKNGDISSTPREICHWIYFKSIENREAFVCAVLALGFSLGSPPFRENLDKERPFGVIVSKMGTTELTDLNNMVLPLFLLAKEHSGDYDGWETSIERA